MDIMSMLSGLFGGGTPQVPPPASVAPLPVQAGGQTFFPQSMGEVGKSPGYGSSPANLGTPSLKDLLGKLSTGLQTQSMAPAQGFAPPQAPDPHQSSTSALAAYKPMDFTSKPIIPPEIMQALMAMRGR